MRFSAGTIALMLALAGCAGPRGGGQPEATTAAAPSISVAGYEGAIQPISSPVVLAYAPARFRSTVVIGVEGGRGTAGRSNSLTVHTTGSLTAEGDRLRGEIVTERIEVDGRPPQNDGPVLIQDLLLDRKGRMIEMASRFPGHAEPSAQLSGRYKALEERWRDRLPVFVPNVIAAGDPIYEDTGLLSPLRQMLQDRPFQMRPIKPVRAVAVGMTACDGGQCLIARHEGEAELVAERGTLHVTASGFTLVDIATGVIRREVGTVTLEQPGGASRLTMTVRTDTQLF